MAILFTCIFLAMMIGIGIWGMKKTQNLGDFFLGGRSVGPWVSAFAYGTSYFSAVIFIGFAGKLGWGMGLNTLWIAVGNAIFGSMFAWLVLGAKTRRMTQNLDVMTMPEFFEARFEAPKMKLLAALVIFIFLLPYSASVYKGLGHIFEGSFGISYDAALIIMTAITGIYLILGGYFAVTLTDFIQGLIMLVGSTLMVAVLVGDAGGLSASIQGIKDGYMAHIPVDKQPPWWIIASLVFMTSFGTWGLPQMIHKFYAIKDEKMIGRAAIVTTIFAAVIGFTAYFTGAMTHVFFDKLPEGGFDALIPTLFETHLPEMLMAVIVVLILSASMSTLSSLILVSSSAIAIDLYKGHVNQNITQENSLVMMRFLSGLFIAMSYMIARYELAIIVTLMSLSWGAVAGAFLAPYLLGLYWKKVTRAGAYVGMFTGLGIVIGSFFVLGEAYAKLSPVVASIAMIAPFITVPLVSCFTQPPSQATIDCAFATPEG